jgi:hypothetical protein
MARWLAIFAMLPLFAAAGAHAQVRPLIPNEIVVVARSHALDWRLAQEQGIERPLPLMRGMLVQKTVAPNAFLGVGLANLYGRKKGADSNLGDRPARSRKPAVTFVMKF